MARCKNVHVVIINFLPLPYVFEFFAFQIRLAEERCEEAEARARQLENQVTFAVTNMTKFG